MSSEQQTHGSRGRRNVMEREWRVGDPQLTTEEVVQSRIREFLQERVDHHRDMAVVMNEPFRSDHQKLARAYEERLESDD